MLLTCIELLPRAVQVRGARLELHSPRLQLGPHPVALGLPVRALLVDSLLALGNGLPLLNQFGVLRSQFLLHYLHFRLSRRALRLPCQPAPRVLAFALQQRLLPPTQLVGQRGELISQ